MRLEAGTLTQIDAFTGSMAHAMEKAMEKEWRNVKGTPLPVAGREDLRLMFAAIAQGVVRHLKNNEEAFHTLSNDSHAHDVRINTIGYLHPFP